MKNQILGVSPDILTSLGITEEMDAFEVLTILQKNNVEFKMILTIDDDGEVVEAINSRGYILE